MRSQLNSSTWRLTVLVARVENNSSSTRCPNVGIGVWNGIRDRHNENHRRIFRAENIKQWSTMGLYKRDTRPFCPFYTEKMSDDNGRNLGPDHTQRVRSAVDFVICATFVSTRTKIPKVREIRELSGTNQ